jgi:hypothetical protein
LSIAGVAPSALAGTVLPAGNAVAQQAAAAAATAADGMPVDLSTYVPGPVEVGWQIWFAAVVSTIPFIIGAYEFGKRIVSARHMSALAKDAAQMHLPWHFMEQLIRGKQI